MTIEKAIRHFEAQAQCNYKPFQEAAQMAVAALHAQQKSAQLERICRAALDKWGATAQTVMVFEEMSELQKELCKHIRGADNVDHIAEEIADVQIMLEQMMILHDCRRLADEWESKKLERLERRINGGKADKA